MRIRVHSPDLNICSAASGSFYNLYQNHVADLECDMKMYLSKLSFFLAVQNPCPTSSDDSIAWSQNSLKYQSVGDVATAACGLR